MLLGSRYVYGFVGPKGGGKSYNLDKSRELSKKVFGEQVEFLSVDFSDPIRKFILEIFGINERWCDLNSADYSIWKENLLPDVSFPTENECTGRTLSHLTGRDLLMNVGEVMKRYSSPNVWCGKAYRDLFMHWHKLSEEKQKTAIVVFGSVRFKSEFNCLLDFAHLTKRKVRLIYFDYNPSIAERFMSNIHPSEAFAYSLRGRGYKHCQVVDEKDYCLLP